jgi:uncharacterized protein (DUF1015 family)
MATIRPFAALRPAPQYAEETIALPYDVMNRKEASVMAEGKPHSFLHITRSEIDLPETVEAYSPEVYQKAASNLAERLSEGALIREKKPMLYVYRQTMDGRTQTGLVACFSIDEYQNNIIKKHELTRVEKEQDRIRHFSTCNANTEPVFLTYRGDPKISVLTEKIKAGSAPVYDLTTPDGIGHALWLVSDDSMIADLTAYFAEIPALYIADGHHRSASAVKVGLQRRQENPSYSGQEEFNYFMAVIFPDSELRIFDYNRVVHDLNGMSEAELLSALSECFEVEERGAEAYRPEAKHFFSMYLNKSWYRLAAKPSILSGNAVKGLDVSILQDHVLRPLLGIEDPRTDHRIDFVGGIRGLAELERRAGTDMKIAFALYPVSVEDLMRISDQEMIMPPKSTWFEPKLGSGLFVHEL